MLLNFDYDYNGLILNVEANIDSDKFCEEITATFGEDEIDFDISEVYILEHRSIMKWDNKANKAVMAANGLPSLCDKGKYIKQTRGLNIDGVYEVVCLEDALTNTAYDKHIRGDY